MQPDRGKPGKNRRSSAPRIFRHHHSCRAAILHLKLSGDATCRTKRELPTALHCSLDELHRINLLKGEFVAAIIRGRQVPRSNVKTPSEPLGRCNTSGMAERAHRIVVARSPMLLHCPPGKLVILRVALVILGAIDQLNDVVDFLVRLCREQLRLGSLQQIRAVILARSLAVARRSICCFLNWSVAIRVRLEKRISFWRVSALEQIARKLAAGAPQIDLEGERVLSRPAVQHPLQRRVGDETAVPDITRLRSRWPGTRAAANRWP